MTKKSQTTGIPKAKPVQKKPESTPEEEKPKGVIGSLNALTTGSLREYQSRAEREAVIQRLIILGVAAALALVVIVLGIAFVSDQIITPGRTVASVNGDNISVREFQQRVRFERVLASERLSAGINQLIDQGLTFEEAGNQAVSREPYATLWQELNTPDLMGLRVINDMINDTLVREEAANREITVSQEQIDEQIQRLFNFDAEEVAALTAETTPEVTEEPATATPTPFVSPTPSPVPSPTSTPETEPTATLTPFPTVPPPPTLSADQRIETYEEIRDDFYSIVRREAGYSREQVNTYFETQALRNALAEVVVEPDQTEIWVNSRHILVETEEEALDIIAALESGESFADLARATSTDTGSGAAGGELGWSPATNFVEPFANAVQEAEIGEIFGPVQSDFGYHIIQVRAREDRELEEDRVEINRGQAFEEWVTELRDSETIDVEISNIWPDYVPADPPWQYRAP